MKFIFNTASEKPMRLSTVALSALLITSLTGCAKDALPIPLVRELHGQLIEAAQRAIGTVPDRRSGGLPVAASQESGGGGAGSGSRGRCGVR